MRNMEEAEKRDDDGWFRYRVFGFYFLALYFRKEVGWGGAKWS